MSDQIDCGESCLDPTHTDADGGMRVVEPLPKRISRGRVPGANWWIGQGMRHIYEQAAIFETVHGKIVNDPDQQQPTP